MSNPLQDQMDAEVAALATRMGYPLQPPRAVPSRPPDGLRANVGAPRRLVILSGCGWSCCGGGQRPVVLAREFVAQGIEVAYYSSVERRTFASAEGVSVFAEADWEKVVSWARSATCGWMMATLAPYLTGCRELAALGWRVCYDLLDDWDGLSAHKDLWPGCLEYERALVAEADAMTCSAPALIERAARLGRLDVRLIRNGGPAVPLSPCDPPEDFLGGDPSAVYSGYLQGSWFDWQCLVRLGEAGIATTVVGNIITDPEIPTVRFVGEKLYSEAMQYVVNADAGIIPFKHRDICRAVDPIKAYDHWAAGRWVVATPEMEALRGRPFVLFATPEEFPEAVREGAERRKTAAPDGAFIAANSWTRRAEQFVDLFWPKPRGGEKRAASVVVRLTEEECKLRVTWQAPVRCDMKPPCPYCNVVGDLERLPDGMPGTADDWIGAFEKLSKQVGGSLYASICFGEPLSDPMVMEVVTRLARSAKIDLVSNLLAAPNALLGVPRNGNVTICASFHPEAWPNLTSFLRRRDLIERTGIRVPTVQVVAWPPYLGNLDAWAAEATEAGAAFGVIPFWGVYRGQSYPGAYEQGTERWQAEPVTGRCGDRWQGFPCRTGKDYLYVGYDGEVYRCVMPSPSMGNLLRDPVIELATEAVACPSERCPCPDLWKFQEIAP